MVITGCGTRGLLVLRLGLPEVATLKLAVGSGHKAAKIRTGDEISTRSISRARIRVGGTGPIINSC